MRMNHKIQTGIGYEFADFIKVFFASSISIVLIQLLRSGNTSENLDKLVYLSSIFVSFISLILTSNSQTKSILVPLFTFAVIIIGMFTVEKHSQINGIDINKILWFGFGPIVGAVAIILLPFSFQIFTSKNRYIRAVIGLIAIVVVLMLIPAAWQGGSSLMEPDSPEYVVNELLSVPSGNIPYINFIPQYGILYSWLISPFASHLSVNGLVTLGLYLMSLGGICAVFIGVWLVYRTMSSNSIAKAILLVVPFTSIAQFPGRISFSGSIYSSPTQIPVRILPGMVVGMLLINSVFAKKRTTRTVSGQLGLLIAGLSLWLNTDFGLSLFTATMFFLLLNSKKLSNFISGSITIVIGFLIYPLLISLSGKNVKIDYFGTFVRQFGNGYGAENIHTPGPVLVILPLIISIFFASNQILVKQKIKQYVIPFDQYRCLVTAGFFSLWSLGGFLYYLNRSYASGQMQILFLPISVAMASFFHYLMIKNNLQIPWTSKSFFNKLTWNNSNRGKNLAYLTLAVIMNLQIASVIAFPNPKLEISRLTKAPNDHKWPLEKNIGAFAEIESILKNPEIKDNAGYFGSSSNYVQLMYGVNSVTIFNSPLDLFMSNDMVVRECEFISTIQPKFIITNDTGAYVAQNFQDKMLCGNYAPSIDYPNRLYIRQ